jgi:hypothetical protein
MTDGGTSDGQANLPRIADGRPGGLGFLPYQGPSLRPNGDVQAVTDTLPKVKTAVRQYGNRAIRQYGNELLPVTRYSSLVTITSTISQSLWSGDPNFYIPPGPACYPCSC